MSRRACKYTVTDITRIVAGAYRAAEKVGASFVVEVKPESVIVRPQEGENDGKKDDTWDDVA